MFFRISVININTTFTSFTFTTLTQQQAPQPVPEENSVTAQPENSSKKPPETPVVVDVVDNIEKESQESQASQVSQTSDASRSVAQATIAEPKRVIDHSKSLPKATSAKDKGLLALPAMIAENQHKACRHALKDLSREQQQRVIDTLEAKQKSEVIYNPTGLLIVLARAEREGQLIVPVANRQRTTPAYQQQVHQSNQSFQHFDSPKHPINEVLAKCLGLNWGLPT
jgi:hypothetical protein